MGVKKTRVHTCSIKGIFRITIFSSQGISLKKYCQDRSFESSCINCLELMTNSWDIGIRTSAVLNQLWWRLCLFDELNILTFTNKEDLARCGVREEICRQLGSQDGDGKAQPAASRMRRSSSATALCWEERDEPAHLWEGRAFTSSTCSQSGTRSILAIIIDPRWLLVVDVDPIKFLVNFHTRQGQGCIFFHLFLYSYL